MALLKNRKKKLLNKDKRQCMQWIEKYTIDLFLLTCSYDCSMPLFYLYELKVVKYGLEKVQTLKKTFTALS